MLKPITDSGVRPAGLPGRCFYCSRPVETNHAEDCVCRRRTVVVRSTMEYVMLIPASWTKEDVEFFLNESTSCADNEVTALQKNLGCLCSVMDTRFVREATEEDERTLAKAFQDSSPGD